MGVLLILSSRRDLSKKNKPNKSLHPTANRLGVGGVVTIFTLLIDLPLRFGRSVELYVR